MMDLLTDMSMLAYYDNDGDIPLATATLFFWMGIPIFTLVILLLGFEVGGFIFAVLVVSTIALYLATKWLDERRYCY